MDYTSAAKYYSLMVPTKKTNKISGAIRFLKLTHVVVECVQ